MVFPPRGRLYFSRCSVLILISTQKGELVCCRTQTLPGILITMAQSRGATEPRELRGLLSLGATHYITITEIRLLHGGVVGGHRSTEEGGIVPHPMPTSAFARLQETCGKRERKEEKKIKICYKKMWASGSAHLLREEGRRWKARRGRERE